MIYLAQPYAHSDPEVMKHRYNTGCFVTSQLILQHLPVFAPIVHCHHLVPLMKSIKLDHDFWLAYDKQMLAMCDKMVIIALDGWDKSRGVTEEIWFANKRKIEVRIMPKWQRPSHTVLLGDYNGQDYKERGTDTGDTQGAEPRSD